MALDLRTDEQRAIDAVVEAKLAIDGPDAERWRSVIAEKREQLDGFVAASQKREQELLHKQAMDRDEFSRGELSEHNQLQATLTAYTDKLSKLAMTYASAVDALRAHYGKVFPSGEVVSDGIEPVDNIRRVLRGDLHGGGVDVRTFVNPDTGDLITRIRRGLHDMGGQGGEVVAMADSPQDAPEGFEPMFGVLGPSNITEALQQGARAIGEDLGALGLDFSLDAAEKG